MFGDLLLLLELVNLDILLFLLMIILVIVGSFLWNFILKFYQYIATLQKWLKHNSPNVTKLFDLAMLLNILNMRFNLCYIHMALYIIKLVQVPLSKMVELKENFVIFWTLFVLLFFLPKFLPHFGVKLFFMLFMRLIAFQALSSIIRLRMSDSLGHPLTIITFTPLDLLVSFFFNLKSITNLSLNLDFVRV